MDKPRSNRHDILADLPCALPSTGIPENIDTSAIAAGFANLSPESLRSTLTSEAVWRDTFALTGTLRTFYSASTVCHVFDRLYDHRCARKFSVKCQDAMAVRLTDKCGWIDVPFTFQTEAEPTTKCSGVISLTRTADNTYKIWMIRTVLERLDGQPDVDKLDPGPRQKERNPFLGNAHFDCVVVGAGHSGLGTAGRLQALGVSYVVIDRNNHLGDNWRSRYDSAKLHTIRNWSHLPFDRTFPPSCGQWLNKDQLADGLRSWALKYDINVWMRTELQFGTWDDSKRIWTLTLQQQEEETKVTCSHVVLAAGGPAQLPRMPQYPGGESFKGIVQHSASYKNSFGWKGKYGVVIGSANTGHDIVDDMLDAGLESVTMVQRSRTYVFPREYLQKAWEPILNDQTPIELSDRVMQTTPMAVISLITRMALHSQAEAEMERFLALERARFKAEVFGDLIYQLNQHLGGHYMDTGTSSKIAQGLIKIKSDSLPILYEEHGLRFDDGSFLPADVVVFATGFTGNLRDSVRKFFGTDIYNRVQDYWGINSEGEIKGAFVPTGHPRLWYVGGGMGQVRFYSRFVALQIRAALNGTPLPVYIGSETNASDSVVQ